MRGHGGGVRLLMLVTGVLIVLASILPRADNAVVFGRYSETLRMSKVSPVIQRLFGFSYELVDTGQR